MNMNIVASALAGLGLAAVVDLNCRNHSPASRAKWRDRNVIVLSGVVGTSFSLLQCIVEGRNVSARTLIALATNASILAYSLQLPWGDPRRDFT
ncbi:hypothetical protein [Endozoicomonas sp. SESOKO1]|uniref:hypothetical protein n=1 Tax=Endozoicomonas sp. SESOKO1 TaxID=2828742 RepID=UPI00214976D6|nr:hypothetical protein [Endozoicomonas sp. SESOKO1]